MDRISLGQFAVFTRNHRPYLEEAVALCAADATRIVTFRAAGVWASAERAVVGSPIPIYMAAVGGPATIEYVGDLVEVQVHPHRGDPKTERLLASTTASTKHEGLWEQYDKSVRTLYAVRSVRKLADAFPMTHLIKVSNGERLDANYRYSYALVVPEPILESAAVV